MSVPPFLPPSLPASLPWSLHPTILLRPQVGSAFQDQAAMEELHSIASEPSKDHVFRVDNFDALQGIQNQLQEKIFAIEGTRGAGGGWAASEGGGWCPPPTPASPQAPSPPTAAPSSWRWLRRASAPCSPR